MAQIPDTPDIADALALIPAVPAVTASVERLRVLHALGGTDEQLKVQYLAERDAARAERDARPTADQLAAVEAERDALQDQLDAINNPPDGPFAVPIVQFRAGLIPMRLRLLASDPATQAMWAVVLGELEVLSVVYPREMPVAGLLAKAVSDGVMLQAEADALSGL